MRKARRQKLTAQREENCVQFKHSRPTQLCVRQSMRSSMSLRCSDRQRRELLGREKFSTSEEFYERKQRKFEFSLWKLRKQRAASVVLTLCNDIVIESSLVQLFLLFASLWLCARTFGQRFSSRSQILFSVSLLATLRSVVCLSLCFTARYTR